MEWVKGGLILHKYLNVYIFKYWHIVNQKITLTPFLTVTAQNTRFLRSIERFGVFLAVYFAWDHSNLSTFSG